MRIAFNVLLYSMKINHAFRADARWDTYRQSRLRASQRTMHNDTLEQLDELFTDSEADAYTVLYTDVQRYLHAWRTYVKALRQYR